MTVPGNVIMVAVVGRGVCWMASESCKTASGARVYVTVRAWLTPLAHILITRPEVMQRYFYLLPHPGNTLSVKPYRVD
ncbi:hypothetical protein BvCmsNSNP012_00771 [Escherichia coli]|nr:hypothetical protein BvCmsNSNP012_00771 [Escherichia coli]